MAKLVRDQILPGMIERGDPAISRVLETEDFKKALIEKLSEETVEVAEQLNNPEELLKELADIEEIVIALLEASGLTRDQLEETRKTKAAKNGAYKNRTYIETVSLRPESEWLDYFRKKYPEVK